MSTNIRSNYTKGYFKMENRLATNGHLLSDQEFRLLSYYMSFPTSYTFRMEKMKKDLNWSESKIKKVRTSLHKNGFLLIRRLPKNEFIYHIGPKSVYEYLLDKKRKEETGEDFLTDEEKEIMRKLSMWIESEYNDPIEQPKG